MTADDLTKALLCLGYASQERQATALGVDVRTVRRWTRGEVPVPAPVQKLVRALDRVSYLERRVKRMEREREREAAQILAWREMNGCGPEEPEERAERCEA